MTRVEKALIEYFSVTVNLDQVPPRIARRLVDALYAQDPRLLHGVVLLLAAALLAYARTGSRWLLAWGALSLPVAFWRLKVARAYRRDPAKKTLRDWTRWAIIGAGLSGALWGAASLVLIIESDPFVQFLLIVCQTAFVAGGAVRNCSVPVVAHGQALFASVPLVLACLASGNAYYQLFSAFALFHIITTRVIIRAVHQQTIAVLLAEDEKAALADELAVANRQLSEMATTDALTLMHNRRGFDVRLANEWRRSRRNRTWLSLLLLDVDCFKLFNDYYGHQAGDECLRRVGQALAEASRRPGDFVARYGGEEFAVILSDTDEFGAVHIGEQIRMAVEALAIPHAACAAGRVTVSVGVATLSAEKGGEKEELVRQADKALYRAKHEGRNRVCFQKGATPLAGMASPLAGAKAFLPPDERPAN